MTPKSAVFSVRTSEGSNEKQKRRGFAAWGRHACYRRPDLLVGSLADVVSSCQVLFESVYICRRYGGKTLPEEAKVKTLAWLRLANKHLYSPNLNKIM